MYEAATDGKNQLRYIAGADAKAMYAMRLQLGDEALRGAMAQQLLGEAKAAYLPQTLRLEQLTRVINTEVFRRSA